MKLFFIVMMTIISMASFAVTFFLYTFEYKMIVCWAACFTLSVICCYMVWVFLAGKYCIYFSATIETTTKSGTGILIYYIFYI